MQLKTTLVRPGDLADVDLTVTADTTATVGALARALVERDPDGGPSLRAPTIRIDDSARILDPDLTIADAGLLSGQHVSLVASSEFESVDAGPAAATLVVTSGPDAGASFPLRAGSNQVGRGPDNDVALSDPQISKAHVRINVGEVVELVDLGSSNGTVVGGDFVQRAVIRAEDVLLGETVVQVVHHHDGGVQTASGVLFNRSPRIDVVYRGIERSAPDPLEPYKRQRVPIIPMIAPILLGCVLFAITQQLVTVLFVALSPFMVLGNILEQRIFGRREHARSVEEFRAAVVQLDADLAEAGEIEAVERRAEHPDAPAVVRAAGRRAPTLWSHRPDARAFLDVRLGLGTMPSRNSVEHRPRPNAMPELAAELRAVIDRHATVAAVPVVASLSTCGSVGFAGPRAAVLPAARAAIGQLVSLHSPAEVVLAVIAPVSKASDWAALKWLPHTASEHSPIGRDEAHLASSPGGAAHLVSALEGVADERIALGDDAPDGPAVVVLVEDDAPVDRSRLVALAERGRRCGIHLVWLATAVPALPAACRVFLEVDPNVPERGSVGFVDGPGEAPGGLVVQDVAVEQIGADALADLARAMCPVVDAGARFDDATDLPRSVPLTALAGTDLVRDPAAVIDRWRTSNSLPAEFARRRKANHLRSVVGSAASGALVLDLREHGPHALVGGTTGSGKSEFLQSWVLGMALEHSPARVSFLFVDYKGGAAFAECVQLPHCVGLVTDLSPQLVQRALTSLDAELHHREKLLNRKRKKDLVELEKEGDPEAPPSLVIVVDEFAALAQEVPDFVDGVVNVAQRGRSLGLHLVLATQRPAGVITGNLRANTNLRVALRVADENDSDDVVGAKLAAGFDPGIPGRAVVKTGPGRLTPFQSGYVGGHTSDVPAPPSLIVQELTFGAGRVWESVEVDDRAAADPGPSDLQRLVTNVRHAFSQAGLEHPRRPWLDELAPVYDLANLPNPSRDDAVLTFGILDDPRRQQQYPVPFLPDTEGNMAIIGTGGSGKSACLRTLGIVAGLGFRGGPCHVYGLDFGARGLTMLEPLPHVGSVVNGDDDERVQRLLRTLRSTIDERMARYAAVDADTIAAYRERAEQPDEPRILLLLDNVGAFRNAYEIGPAARIFDLLVSIAADGRQVGVHLAISADRPAAMPSSLHSVIQKQLVLRLSSENDLLSAGVPTDWFEANTPPGRGFLDGNHVQVLLLGGSANTSRQSEAIRRLADQLAERTDRRPAPPIERLPELVSLDDLPATRRKKPVIGISGETLDPLGITADDVFLVAGPPQSGRTTALATVVAALGRAEPAGERVYLGPGRSFLRGVFDWHEEAMGVDDIAELAPKLRERVQSGWHPAVVVVEDHAALLNGPADQPVLELVTACRAEGVLVLADGEIGALGGWALQNAMKAGRQGLLLQPDQPDGEQIYKTPLPRVQRADFPVGRGFYIRSGRAELVQVAMPETT